MSGEPALPGPGVSWEAHAERLARGQWAVYAPEPALPVDVEVGRHGRLTVVAEASGNVVIRDDLGPRLHTVRNVDQLVRDLITARDTIRSQEHP